MNRLDVYSAVHKMQRARLFELTTEAGRTDVADTRAAEEIAGAVEAMIEDLLAHADHEERFIHPLLSQKAPEVASILEAAHFQLDALMGELSDRARNAETSADDPNGLYRALARFTAAYLEHLDDEEQKALPILWDACSDDELMGILISFKGSRTPTENLASLMAQLPTLSSPEIYRMVSAVRGEAPISDLAELLATLLRPRQLAKLNLSTISDARITV
jgi:iron-sulfur cluster repair protein YtfE (RIC family)